MNEEVPNGENAGSETHGASDACGSRARNPDLNWSQVRETILMLDLAVAQMDMAMKDSDGSVEVLTNSFAAMVGQVRMIEDLARELPEESHDARDSMLGACETVSTAMQQAIVAFQFYDKLSQRLTHVSHSIDRLAELIGDGSRLFSPYEWVALQERIKSKYTMDDERLMFEAIMNGVPVQQALADFTRGRKEKADATCGDIELF